MYSPITPQVLRAALAATLLISPLAFAQSDQSTRSPAGTPSCLNLEDRAEYSEYCTELQQVTILGRSADVANVPGGADVVTEEVLQDFAITNVTDALRRVPGVSIQTEDGYGLRPNISIRGTATDRSGRITLLEDDVLIAPAPYAAPSAYYFPTMGRISRLEVLKGPAAITEGPYTVGGALNLISTPIPGSRGGRLVGELGTDSTWRGHLTYGDPSVGDGGRFGYLLETHQWQSDGYQTIDRSNTDTGLDKEDYLAKFRIRSGADAAFDQSLTVKLQASEEDSNQSYLGLTDADFAADPYRRYGLSERDNFDADHQQIQLNYRINISDELVFTAVAYNNEFARNWFKTEGIDFDGSASAGDLDRTSWFNVIQAINRGQSLGGFSAAQLQAILDGTAETLPGSIELRNNDREYYSRGIEIGTEWDFRTGNILHRMDASLRYHEDEEDRLQRKNTYQQINGQLVLSDIGELGNAGNRLQQAEAWSFYVRDTMEISNLTLAPGIRYESIDQTRIDYNSQPERNEDELRRTRSNSVDVWIPGVGALYTLNNNWRLIAGVHKGFSAPTNAPGVDEEESIDYEAGIRYDGNSIVAELLGFYQDYDNLLGTCTASSGVNCEVGDAFNGDAVTIPGLELSLSADLSPNPAYALPVTLAYTWMDAEFDSTIADTEFFGDVNIGDPVPYIPDNQLFASVGFEQGPWAAYLSANYQGSVCTRASCGPFEQTDSSLRFNAALHRQINTDLSAYLVVENLTNEADILGRQPYGARPGQARTARAGINLDF